MSESKYWDVPMNFVGGCTPISKGCRSCWAADCASKRLANHPLYKGLTKNGKWTGEVRVMPELIKVIGGKPKTIFWCNMADMFHEKVAFEDICLAFRKMLWDMPQHNHLILTKRVRRMAEYFEKMYDLLLDEIGAPFCSDEVPGNIHLGATICNQKEADEIMPIALQIPGFDWVSAEPLLEAIDFQPYCDNIGWFVLGCESGPKRRHISLADFADTFYTIDNQTTRVFVKQIEINGKVCHDIDKFPTDLQVREPVKGE